MKKIIAWLLSLALVLSLAGALAETEENIFEKLSVMEWSFSSGAGGWSADMRINPDGTFTGNYHDSEMGETGEKYPDGTLYYAIFKGKMSVTEKTEENTWKIKIESIETEEPAGNEKIEDEVRYVSTEVYGLAAGDEMILYAPGTPVSVLSEEMQLWAHVMDQENPPAALENWFLSNTSRDSGFVGYEVPAGTLANPWEEMTPEQLMENAGVAFKVPEGAENVVYRYMKSEELAEMQFTLKGIEFCARMQSADLRNGEMKDISGMYYEWEKKDDIQVVHCPGVVYEAKDSDGTQVKLCLWYDLAPGYMYSLSAVGQDLSSLDMTAMAEQTFIPLQGDTD